jgi:dienelactone hydrolase
MIIVPDLFSPFTGDREALARGKLSDDEMLRDIDAVVAYLRALPQEGGRSAPASRSLTARVTGA